MAALLWAIIAVLFISWAVSVFALHVAGAVIHLLLVVVAILIVINLITGRSART